VQGKGTALGTEPEIRWIVGFGWEGFIALGAVAISIPAAVTDCRPLQSEKRSNFERKEF
jgi:hypothetical protein